MLAGLKVALKVGGGAKLQELQMFVACQADCMLAWCQFDQLQPTRSVATHSKAYAGHPPFVSADEQ
jgi:hypothetical protein